ncbi:MAG: type II secretion system protein [Phycisphaerales bacterium]
MQQYIHNVAALTVQGGGGLVFWWMMRTRASNMRPGRGTEKGFSLIELVVSLGVLAILIGLVLPALGGARRRGRMATEVVHVRTLMQLVVQYAATYQDYFPTCGNGPGAASASFPRPLRLAGLLVREDDAISRTGQVWQLTATAYIDPLVIRPGVVPASDAVVMSPRKFADVLFPSAKGVFSPVRRMNEAIEMSWCCGNAPAGACAFADGSADEYRWSDFSTAEGLQIEMWAGVPIFTTWDGVRGKDKHP